MLCIAGERPRGSGLIHITYSELLVLIFNKEDRGKHTALIMMIIKKITDYVKNVSLSKQLPTTFIGSKCRVFVIFAETVSSVIRLPSYPCTGV